MELAWAAAARGSGIYDQVFFGQVAKFQYPLTVLTLAGGVSRSVLNVLSWVATLATAVCAPLIFRASIRREPAARAAGFRADFATDLLLVVAVLAFYPVVKGYSLGQIQTVVTALFALLLLAWLHQRPVLSGLALGIMLLIKPSSAPLLLWGAARREWRFVATASATTAAGVLVALWRFPLREQLDYVRVLSFIGQRGELFYANQSFNGLLNRWVADGGSLVWHDTAFAEPNRLVALATTALFVAAIAAALLLVPRSSRGSAHDLGLMMLASTMAAPIAWEHHYGVLAPMLAAAWPWLAVRRPFGGFGAVAFGGATLLAANYVPAANWFDGAPLSPVQSYLLFAACVLWVLMLRATMLGPRATEPVR